MWDLIINPFVTLLTVLYSVLSNDIVLAIIVLTIIIRLATYPLTVQQQKSAKAMQELQPKLKKLQEKHKNDREKLSQAQMELYKEHGVNPFGGCLPLLIQFPILIGLYQAIIHALAATPFQLVDLPSRLLVPGLDGLIPLQRFWLGMDLTQPPTLNPQYALVLPLLVLATTWIQQKFAMPSTTKTEGDDQPSQAQAVTQSMTTIMPLMFGFFSLSFSVGLSIYFVVSNIVGIFQYGVLANGGLNRLLGRSADDESLAVAPAGGSSKKGNKAKAK